MILLPPLLRTLVAESYTNNKLFFYSYPNRPKSPFLRWGSSAGIPVGAGLK